MRDHFVSPTARLGGDLTTNDDAMHSWHNALCTLHVGKGPKSDNSAGDAIQVKVVV
jgi:hypothetical protein